MCQSRPQVEVRRISGLLERKTALPHQVGPSAPRTNVRILYVSEDFLTEAGWMPDQQTDAGSDADEVRTSSGFSLRRYVAGGSFSILYCLTLA